MSTYSFLCWNDGCGDMVDRTWDEVEEDVSGRMAYCSQGCFSEHCTMVGEQFQGNHPQDPPYVVGLSESEERLFTRLRQINPYIAHSIEEEEVDTFSGNWHYIWLPDLEELKAFAQEVAEEGQDISQAMAGIDYSEWDEFVMFTHPVKGIVFTKAWEFLQGRSVSLYAVSNQVEMQVKPSEPNFVQK